MLTALLIIGGLPQAVFALVLIGMCLAVAGAVVWVISHD